MKILGIDTTTQACSVALIDTDSEDQEPRQIIAVDVKHAEVLFPMIAKLFKETDTRYQDIDRLAVTIGPGSFTGVRVGVAAAKGISLSLPKLKLSGYSSLHVIAYDVLNSYREHGTKPFDQILAVIDARRGEVYCQTFDASAKPISEVCAIKPDMVSSVLSDKKTLVVGTFAGLNQNQNLIFYEKSPEYPSARSLCQLSEVMPGKSAPFSPLYIREPDAKIQKGHSIERALE